MNKERLVNSLKEIISIYSPSKNEAKLSEYLIKELENLGADIYLDKNYVSYGGNAPTIIAKFKGDIEGEGVTFSAHMDVVEPNEGVKIIIEDNIMKTDGKTTLGGDDKAGIASILESIRVIKENNISHKDIFVIFTPCEEIGMVGAKSVLWKDVPENMMPSKNMIVVDNAGKAGLIAHSAPSKYGIKILIIGKKAHAGIEPEKGINAIKLAAMALANMEIGRIDSLTTSNISTITSNFPSNVVPDICELTGEVRGHSIDRIEEILKSYKESIEDVCNKYGGEYKFEATCDYPVLKPKDDLKFANEFKKVYESIGVDSELKVIGGGSDSNIFAEEGFNSIIIGVGMEKVHTTSEYLELEELFKTTTAIITYLKNNN